ncbi:polysaccharide lyase family 7 protein [Cognaticolwellia beringensis]|uniref:polysaccharide lyase family 7 protein n=1 Tax=Cognaticolwellia beringensis TaxID=1967665 RepID=UPI0009BEFA97|nr:polysaccharide lyase family 7 protein [Cognaticolwellia beringensis]
MQIQKSLLTFMTLFGLAGCGGSTSSNTTPQEAPKPADVQTATPAYIDDISCNVSYPLQISMINSDSEEGNLPTLFDKNKTNVSSWQATETNSNLVITLAEPALIKQMVITWQNLNYAHLYNVYASKDQENWQLLNSKDQSEKNTLIPDVIRLDEISTATAKYLKIELLGNEVSEPSKLLEIEALGCESDVSHNIELIDWYLSVPTDEDNNGKSDSIKEDDLADGYFDPRFFSLSKDGGLIFSTSVTGYKTSTNTNYVRSELREMLRRGNTSHSTQGVNKNNWVFSTAPQIDLNNAGGIDGELTAELAVNSVTTTGEDYQIGRVIIGQIHANDDEPVRLYYRKLPNNSNGAIYIAHEELGGDDTYYEIIGSRSNSADNPTNGIALNEKFSYSITVVGHALTVTITKADGSEFEQTVDMTQSGYDVGSQYMYFKAGVYNQNNSGDAHDYVQATFYQIDNSHSGYPY